MSEDVIQPTAVYRPNRGGVIRYDRAPIRTGRQREQPPIGGDEAVTATPEDRPSGPDVGSGGGGRSVIRRGYDLYTKLPGGSQWVKVPPGIPKFLGNRSVIMFSWMAAMAMVSWNEWNAYHILPRPARLWKTSFTYFLLTLVSVIDPLVPLASALAIGLTVVLAYQYYTNAGAFSGGAPVSQSNNPTSPTPTAPTTGTGANPGTPASNTSTTVGG